MNCPVCYDELFSSEELAPRALPCGHVCCTRCLRDMFDADGLTCSECFEFAPCASVDDLPLASREELCPEVRPLRPCMKIQRRKKATLRAWRNSERQQ